jgi:hypothetical protein
MDNDVKSILKKQFVRMWINSTDPAQGPVKCSFEYDNEPSIYIKGGECFDLLNDYQILRMTILQERIRHCNCMENGTHIEGNVAVDLAPFIQETFVEEDSWLTDRSSEIGHGFGCVA